MKVQIKDLQPNPYRDMENYPIDQDKIESLKNSIEQTGFWDNILARKVEGKIQIAYGHHRLAALKQVMKPTDYVDIPVKDLNDATMIQIMANENMEQWQMNPAVIIETVKVARDFLNAELAKYESWEASNKFIKRFIDKFNFDKVKQHGVGQTTIQKFLGSGWKQSSIQSALNTLDDQEVSHEAVTSFDNLYQGDEFKKAVRKMKKEGTTIPKEAQIELVHKVKERLKENKGKNIGAGKLSKPIQTIVRQEVEKKSEFDTALRDLELELEAITKSAEKLSTSIGNLNGRLHVMGVSDLKGLQSIFVMESFTTLITNMSTLVTYFGFENELIERLK